MRRGGPFSLRTDGGVDARLSCVEADALRTLGTELLGALGAPEDPSLQRLFPDASKDDPDLAAEFKRLTFDDLVAHKADSARALVRTIDEGARKRDAWRGTLSADDARAWLAAINDARLVLGTRIDVTEDMDHRPLPASDPRAAEHNMYVYLSALEDALVDAFLGGMPLSGTD